MKSSIANLGLIFALFLVMAGKAGIDSNPQIRVLIGQAHQQLMIEGEALKIFAGGKKISSSGKVQIEIRNDKLWAKEKKLGDSVKITAQSPIAVNGRIYRGGIWIKKAQADFLIINQLPIEDYLAGVVKNEMNSKWSLEALKAQTVLARSYALGKVNQPRAKDYDLVATVEDQVYSGVSAEDSQAWQAINQTKGEVLFYQKELAQVFYHSCCGGKTESAQSAWGGAGKPYLKSVDCAYCQECPYYFWRYPEQGVLTPEEIANQLGYLGESVEELKIVESSPSQRVLKIQVRFKSGYEAVITGNDFRIRLGRDKIKSTLFKIEKSSEGFVLFGSGSGHGVGLCQWGAKGMAEQGKSYKEILEFYFPGTELKRIY